MCCPKNVDMLCTVSPVLCHEGPELAAAGPEEPGQVVGVQEEVAAHHQAAQPAHCLDSAQWDSLSFVNSL